ncbi:angiotensin-converting enzyme-like [Uloborus diversus]|uniref:angiotensin-converting enzyme-like n=1 Tax=Uloborus diversus TaxID=327109 RepID=UPI002408FE93|nr:angiotensin-converting enzyme-like [Uloborus diversus]
MVSITCLMILTSVVTTLAQTERYISGDNMDMEAALQFLIEHNERAAQTYNRMGNARWNYQTNLNEETKEEMLRMTEVRAEFVKEAWKNATSFAWKDLFEGEQHEIFYRWFKKLSVLGSPALPKDRLSELNKLIADMQDIYSTAKVCAFESTDCSLSLDPDLTELLRGSRNFDELKHVWSQWRDKTGKKMKGHFLKYVQLTNEAARLNGFSDAGDLWREVYESETFVRDVEALWKTMEPLYQQLHAYVRRKLIQQYPGRGIRADGPIPAHLLGNMWAQSWGNIFDLVKPYPDKEFIDVTDMMQEKKMTPLDMFKLSEDFFISLGLLPMTPEFWNRSVIEKPKGREMVCHASAWNFFDRKDFRIKMCTKVNMQDLITVHHEMGHVQYYQQYAKQPVMFQSGANPGFHEAVGDVLALSVSTSDHLRKIGLLGDVPDDDEADINHQMKTALSKIAFLPFGYLIDSWRWKVFSGEIPVERLNSGWWEHRLKYQGLCPPVKRTDEDLDAAAKYHVASDVPYIRYFVSYVIQFQFHKALCKAAEHQGPLHKCDIYQNKAAGQLLRQMLRQGSSVEWKEAMRIVTDSDRMDANPLLEYFEPLLQWLQKQNEGEVIGWESANPMACP